MLLNAVAVPGRKSGGGRSPVSASAWSDHRGGSSRDERWVARTLCGFTAWQMRIMILTSDRHVTKAAPMRTPWNDWIPGVLNKIQVKELSDVGLITVEASIDDLLDESSMDLSLSNEAFRMVQGSVKPSASYPYSWFLRKERKLAEKLQPNQDGIYILKAKETYVFNCARGSRRGWRRSRPCYESWRCFRITA